MEGEALLTTICLWYRWTVCFVAQIVDWLLVVREKDGKGERTRRNSSRHRLVITSMELADTCERADSKCRKCNADYRKEGKDGVS